MTPTYTSPTMQPQRRSGFTLIELLAVMLLILTVLGMGVPAMFASERKSYANQAMSELLRVHQACMAMQVYLAALGDPGIINLSIASVAADFQVKVQVTGSTTSFNPQKWMGMTLAGSAAHVFNSSISAEQFIGDITATNGLTWTYQQKTGFPVFSSPTAINTLSFKALPAGLPVVYKMTRPLNIYPQGYSEIP
jgi:prepilin-type N-terminal cleavage/methylation domain-containing protein